MYRHALVISLFVLPAHVAIDMSPRVVLGEEADADAYPYFVRLSITTDEGTSRCGAFSVSDEHLITAAHCVSHATAIERVEDDGDPTTPESVATTWYVHDQYNTTAIGVPVYDVAVVAFAPGTFANTINLAPSSTSVPMLQETTVIGVGSTVPYMNGDDPDPDFPDHVREAIQIIVPCLLVYNLPDDTQYCARGESPSPQHPYQTDACAGDSGGPLILNSSSLGVVALGIVSAGIGCGDPTYPSIYASIPTLRAWIDAHTLTSPPAAPPPSALPPRAPPQSCESLSTTYRSSNCCADPLVTACLPTYREYRATGCC